MKILFISNIIGKKVGSFAIGSILASQQLGFEYHMAANFNNSTKSQMIKDEKEYKITLHHIDFARNPFNLTNRKAYKQIIDLIKTENFDVIHCNTPVGGVIGRLAGKKCNVKEIIYQAHGFHFYKGASFKNWLLYYPAEKILARYTDKLITINTEDYNRAKLFPLREGGKVYYIPGVGIDLNLNLVENIQALRNNKRAELGLGNDDIVLISAGELNANKNNTVIIKAMALLGNKRLHYVVCGVGDKEKELKKQVEDENLTDNVHFLGYRTDINELYYAADIFVLSSFREGLSRAIMEAMRCGLPCIVSKIRGNIDLIEDGLEGYTCDPKKASEFAERIGELSEDADLRLKMGCASKQNIKKFSLDVVVTKLADLYKG